MTALYQDVGRTAPVDRATVMGAFLAVWLCAINGIFLATSEINIAILVTIAGGIAFYGIYLWTLPQAHIRQSALFWMFILFGPIFFGLLFNAGNERHVVQPLLLFGYAFVGMILAVQPSSFRQALALLALLLTGTFLVMLSAHGFDVLHMAFVMNMRAMFGAHPNFIGLVAIVTVLCALAVQRWPIRWAIIAFSIVMVVAVQSRTALVTILFALGLYAVLRTRWRHPYTMPALLLLGMGTLGVAALTPVLDLVLDRLLLATDRYRGLDTGLAGRTAIWARAVEVWTEAPILGVGYGRHAEIMAYKGGRYSHNMFLTVLTETGVVGLIAYVGAWIAAARKCFALGIKERVPAIVLTILGTYWVYGLAEGRALNVGNVLSILYILAIFYVLNLRPVEGGAEQRSLRP